PRHARVGHGGAARVRNREGRRRRGLPATEVDFGVVEHRALLTGTGPGTGSRSLDEAEASLSELSRLTDTAGADPVESVLQRRAAPDPATSIGPGKADELRALADAPD